MATQGPSQGYDLATLAGPLAMRQASCALLEFAALAVSHQRQHPFCPPISSQEKVRSLPTSTAASVMLRCAVPHFQPLLRHADGLHVRAACWHSSSTLLSLVFVQAMAKMSPHLPLTQAWFKATAVGSAPQSEPQLGQDPQSSMDQAAVAATDFSCRVGSLTTLLTVAHEGSNVQLPFESCMHFLRWYKPRSELFERIHLLMSFSLQVMARYLICTISWKGIEIIDAEMPLLMNELWQLSTLISTSWRIQMCLSSS